MKLQWTGNGILGYLQEPDDGECGRLTAMPSPDPCVSDSELAKKIMQYLGFSVEPSMEPGADRRRDTIAMWMREAIDVALLGQQKVLSAEEVTEGFYWQRDDDNCEWGVNYVCPEVGYMLQAGVAERLEIFGQFKGPIRMREV